MELVSGEDEEGQRDYRLEGELASQLSSRVTRAVMPDFFFRERGGG